VNKDLVFLKHIKDEIDFLEEQFSAVDEKELLSNPLLQRATIRSLEIIGEAVKNLSEDIKTNNTQIEWKEIAGMRDKLIHRYFTIDWDIVNEVIRDRLPELSETVNKALNNFK
jgi:uncharacterized protein with HEPN domain